MLYTIIIKNQDNTTAATYTTDATDARTAHEHAAAAYPAAVVRVYPSTLDSMGNTIAAGLARGALMVARRTAANGIKRTGGNATQCRIEREFAAANVRCRGAETATRIMEVVEDYSHDTQEEFAVALAGLTAAAAAGLPIDEQYRAAYLELNRHIHAQRAATERELSTEYVIDGGGNVVAINAAIATVIRGGERYEPAAATMCRIDGNELAAALRDALALVTPTQRKTVELLARGYSVAAIAHHMKRNERTVKANIAIVRGKLAAYMQENAPDVLPMVNGEGYAAYKAEGKAAAAHRADANNHRTDEGKAAKKANNAAYCKEYRERRKAAKMAANA